MMIKKNILLLCPHPDDVFISCGGFVLQNINKYNFFITCFSSKGPRCYETRKKEEIKAWKRVSEKISLEFFEKGFDTKLQEEYVEIVDYIENLCKKLNPCYIFAPFFHDTHQDHVTISNASMSACRYNKNLLFYETPSTLKFYPSIYFEINREVLKEKKEISKVYRSQILGNEKYKVELSEIIESKALSNGTSSRICKYAESFIPFKLFL